MIKKQEKISKNLNFNSYISEKVEKLNQVLPKLSAGDDFLANQQMQNLAIIDGIPDMVWLKDKNLKYLCVNSAFAVVCKAKKAEIAGKSDLDLWPFEIAQSYRVSDRKVLNSGLPLRAEEPLVNKDGKVKWIETFRVPIFGKDKNVIAITGISRDFTERKNYEEKIKEFRDELELRVKVRTAELSRANEELTMEIKERQAAEDRLRQSQDRYRAVVETQTEMICRFKKNGEITFVNEAYCRCFRKKQDELLGNTFFPLIHENDRKMVKKNIESLSIEKPIISHDQRVVLADGSVRWQRWVNRAIFDSEGNFLEYQAVGRDITEYKEAEIALKDSELFLKSVFESIQDGISILDKKMNIIRVNPAMEKWYAHNMPLVGKKCYAAYHCADKPCQACPSALTLKTGQANYEVVPKRSTDGKIVGWLDLYSFPLLDTNTGKITGIIEYVRDITKNKLIEDEHQKLNEELARTNQRLKQLALRDAHTGLYNHRYLQEVIDLEFQRAKRYAYPLSIIMLDIDYFKSINDGFGHQYGDLVLKRFARELKRLVRRYDIVVRSGGEEFVIISPNIDLSQAVSLAQRLLKALNLYNFGDEERVLKLRVSFSVISYPENMVSHGVDLINLADRILNKVKELGGNNVYTLGDIRSKKALPLIQRNGQESIKTLKEKLEKLTKRANQDVVESIFALAKTIELKDHYTGEHVENIVHYVEEICKSLNLSREETLLIKQASMLHDLGKIGVSDKVLLKKKKLNIFEFEEIKKHPQIGADILRPIHFLHNLVPLIFYHHERWDGKGYPSGIKKDEIPLGARIIAIADVFQALTSDRPYRKAYSKKKAMEIIRKSSGTHFDPEIASVFLKILAKEEK